MRLLIATAIIISLPWHCQAFETYNYGYFVGMYIYAQDYSQQYLGYITHDSYDSESIINDYGLYGSSYSATSIRNDFSLYGSSFGIHSAYNDFSFSPPIIYSRNGSYFEPEAYLTKNHFLAGTTVDPDGLIQYLLTPPPAILDMVEPVSFSINQQQVTLSVDKITNTSIGSVSGLLSLKLWATDIKYSGGTITGYVLGSYQFTELLLGGYYFDNIVRTVSLVEPPAGTYYVTMTLSEWNGSYDLIVDYVTFSESITFGDDKCPNDPNKIDPGICGCGVADTDSDIDGTPDCNDLDDDDDNLPDAWEATYGLDPLDATGENGKYGDFDGDGWANYEEYDEGTNPADKDSKPIVKGDINEDHIVDLKDAILVLQVLVNLDPDGIYVDADVNDDGQIGLEEVIYILQDVAELR